MWGVTRGWALGYKFLGPGAGRLMPWLRERRADAGRFSRRDNAEVAQRGGSGDFQAAGTEGRNGAAWRSVWRSEGRESGPGCGECRAGGTERLSPKGNFVRIHVSNIGC